jgi:hypothetical protein
MEPQWNHGAQKKRRIACKHRRSGVSGRPDLNRATTQQETEGGDRTAASRDKRSRSEQSLVLLVMLLA